MSNIEDLNRLLAGRTIARVEPLEDGFGEYGFTLIDTEGARYEIKAEVIEVESDRTEIGIEASKVTGKCLPLTS